MKVKQLVKSGILYTSASILRQALGFITVPYFAHNTTQESFGLYGLFASYYSIFVIISGLQISSTLGAARVKFDSNFEFYTKSAYNFTFLISSIFTIMIILLKSYFSKWLGFSETIIIFLAIGSLLSVLTNFWGDYLIQTHQTNLNFWRECFITFISVGLSILLVHYLSNDLFARVIGGISPMLLLGLYSLIYFGKNNYFYISRNYLKFMLMTSIPLIFHQLSSVILSQFDRIMIRQMLSVKDVAVYSFGYSLGALIQIFLMNLNVAWLPWYIESKKANVNELKKYIKYYIYIGLFFSLGYLTISPDLALLMGGEKYSQSNNFIGFIIISMFFIFLDYFPVNVLYFHANTKYIPIGTVIAGAVNVLLNYYAIPVFGIYGSVIATVLSYLLLLIFHHMIAKQIYHYDDLTLKDYFKVTSVIVLYNFLMQYFINSLLIRWVIGITVLVLYIIIFNKELIFIFKKYDFKHFKRRKL